MAVARNWVKDACHASGHTELLDSASLGVSELLTNALLHAEPPYTVHWVETAESVRVEVHDSSVRLPTVVHSSPGYGTPGPVASLATLGRGLRLVQMVSSEWGVRVHPLGKAVWFVPAPDGAHERTPAAAFEAVVEPASPPEVLAIAAPPTQQVVWHGLNRRLVEGMWFRQRAMRRELTLLNLRQPTPTVTDFLAAFTEMGRELPAHYFEPPTPAARTWTGKGAVDPVTVNLRWARLEALLGEVYRDHRLLSVERNPELHAFTAWLMGEVTRQCAGEQPRAWSSALAHPA